MRGFIEEVGRTLNFKKLYLIEKDFLLHKILSSVVMNKWFREGMVFKGGTCLIKGYLGYYRFSEDLDFTWRDQSQIEKLSGRELRGHLSALISTLGTIIEGVSDNYHLDFRCIKSNNRYFEYGGSGRTTTLKVWYESEILNTESFVKIQVNFVEDILYNPKIKELSSLMSNINDSEINKYFQ